LTVYFFVKITEEKHLERKHNKSMENPLFWLGLSLGLVAMSLTAVLIAFIPLAQELAHTARSAEKLLDTLNQELPTTLEAIRMTNVELTELSEEMKGGVKSASGAVKNIDRSIVTAKKQAQNVQHKSRNLWAGLKAGIKTWQTYDDQ
jgi:hypothetical protein